MNKRLLIQNGNTVYEPVVKDEITWITERKGVAGKLEFKIIKDNIINFEEGNPVAFKVDNTNLFYGFVFKKKRDKEKVITTTAYDQLRYLKNKDTKTYTNKRADELVKMIANEYQLNVGILENTGYVIAKKAESNQELFDMILSIHEKGHVLMEYGQIIAHRILSLCKARGVSVNKLARMSNLKQSTLDNIINGRSQNPRLMTLHKISYAFTMTISEFLDFPEIADYAFEDGSDENK